ncbi:MAG: OmpA family protein, partial [Prolixibacteraceae bacterium]|nr:OmpA family protein [Prolixibacteraceae bacterium]
MKTGNLIIIISVFVSFLISCNPVYRCGESRPEKFSVSKRILAVVDERDSLCTTLQMREDEISSLKTSIANLSENIVVMHKNIGDIERKYHDLMNKSLSESEQYSLALKQKTEELEAKERLLQEREHALNELQQVIARQDSITRRLNDAIRNALLGFQSDELSVDIINGKVYVSMSDKLLFKSGSAAIESKGKEAIKVLADVLDKNRDIDILVEGHTDSIPIRTAIFKDNWDLSVARATSIVRILTSDYNITPTRLTASGKGEYSPKAPNSTPEGRAVNRRTEI